ncbi:MAG TPA: hypothetical protein VJB93_03450 [Patescibacteria group bacterium]|nr:hypothetical protein [Patescibacteria group bacterium]
MRELRTPHTRPHHPGEYINLDHLDATTTAEQQARIKKATSHSRYAHKRPNSDLFNNISRTKRDDAKHYVRDRAVGTDQEKEWAHFFETMIATEFDVSLWLTPDIRATLTTDYDDLRNGIDFFLYFKNEKTDTMQAIGIDLTYTSSQPSLRRKVESPVVTLERRAEAGGTIEFAQYMDKNDEPAHDSFKHIPRVTIGLSLEQLFAMLKTIDARKYSHNALASTPEQFIFAEQIINQLAYQATEAARALIQHDVQFLYQQTLPINRTIVPMIETIFKNPRLPHLSDHQLKELMNMSDDPTFQELAQKDKKGYIAYLFNTIESYKKIQACYQERMKIIPETAEEQDLRDTPIYRALAEFDFGEDEYRKI